MPEIKCSYTDLKKPGELKPNPRNPNVHPTKQLDLYARIIEAQGWRRPITVSRLSGLVVRGHGALEVALMRNWPEVPVEYQDYETEADELADLLADNELARLSEIDAGLKDEILASLRESDLDLRLAAIMPEQKAIQEDLADQIASAREWQEQYDQAERD